jgi:hypothetical protein
MVQKHSYCEYSIEETDLGANTDPLELYYPPKTQEQYFASKADAELT